MGRATKKELSMLRQIKGPLRKCPMSHSLINTEYYSSFIWDRGVSHGCPISIIGTLHGILGHVWDRGVSHYKSVCLQCFHGLMGQGDTGTEKVGGTMRNSTATRFKKTREIHMYSDRGQCWHLSVKGWNLRLLAGNGKVRGVAFRERRVES